MIRRSVPRIGLFYTPLDEISGLQPGPAHKLRLICEQFRAELVIRPSRGQHGRAVSAQDEKGIDRTAGGAPLAGLTDLDLTRLIPGGYCTLLLADMGADVLKVEEPGRGDYIRWAPPMVGG